MFSKSLGLKVMQVSGPEYRASAKKGQENLFSLLLDTMTDFVFVGSDITVQGSAKIRIEELAPFQMTIWNLN